MGVNSKKSGGGPKSTRGKQTSSQNAVVHGATSNNFFSNSQKVFVDQYVQELVAYYRPVSPLEILQIQRIALCKAKLDALYELEQHKLQIALEDLKRDPKLVMDSVYSTEDLTRSFAETLSQGKQINLPMDLTGDQLKIFSEEINRAGGKLDPDDNLYTQLPKLGEFITEVENSLKITGYQVILRIGCSVQELLDKKTNDSDLIEVMKLGLDVMQARVRGDEAYIFQKNKIQVDEDLDAKKINDSLSAITKLNSILIRAHQLSKEFEQKLGLMHRSVTLSGEESDRLLRYQTTWERRLSSAIGELLALQAKNVK
jgi:hypothetical protein